jgi:hypothetical protein
MSGVPGMTGLPELTHVRDIKRKIQNENSA